MQSGRKTELITQKAQCTGMGSLKVKSKPQSFIFQFIPHGNTLQLCCHTTEQGIDCNTLDTPNSLMLTVTRGSVPAAIQTQIGQNSMFLPQNSCVKHRPPGRRASATSAPQPAASARSGATSRTGGCPDRWEPPPGLCLLSWRASLSVWGKGEAKHSTVRAAGSQGRDQSSVLCSCVGRALLCCMQMQNRKELCLATPGFRCHTLLSS